MNSSREPFMPVIEVSSANQYLIVSGDTPLLEVYAALPDKLYPPFPPVELPGGLDALIQRGGFAQNFFFSSEVLGATILTSSGEQVQAGGKTVKNVQGFDLVRPLIGSFGRLGRVEQATLRLRPGLAFVHVVREGPLEDALDLEPRFLWQDGDQTHAVLFGHARAIAAFERAFGGIRVDEPLDYRSRFPLGMGVGEGSLRDSRFGWTDGDSVPQMPELFGALVGALGGLRANP